MSKHIEPLDTPLEIIPSEGEVVITGPNGFSGSLTVEAAIASARRLLAAANEIAGPGTYQKPLG